MIRFILEITKKIRKKTYLFFPMDTSYEKKREKGKRIGNKKKGAP